MKGGTIYKEGNKWIWKSPPYDGGRRTRKSFDTLQEAEAQRELFLAKYIPGRNNYVCGMTVREAYERWRKYTWKDESLYTYNTQSRYASSYRKHILPYIGDLKVDKLNMDPFNRHLQEMADNGLKAKTIKNTKQALSTMLRYAKKIGWIDIDNSDKMEDIDVANGRSVEIVNVISESEYKRIYYGLNVSMCSMYAPIVKFIKNTGVRAEELAIKEEDIAGNTLKIRRAVKRKEDVKGHSKLVVTEVLKSSSAYRTVPLNDEAKKAIREFTQWKKEKGIESEYIFCTSRGNLLEYRSILRAFHTAIDRANDDGGCYIEKRGLHSLRKLFCKTLYDKVQDWEKTRRIMGHSAESVTKQFYYDLNFDDIEDIADMLS